MDRDELRSLHSCKQNSWENFRTFPWKFPEGIRYNYELEDTISARDREDIGSSFFREIIFFKGYDNSCWYRGIIQSRWFNVRIRIWRNCHINKHISSNIDRNHVNEIKVPLSFLFSMQKSDNIDANYCQTLPLSWTDTNRYNWCCQAWTHLSTIATNVFRFFWNRPTNSKLSTYILISIRDIPHEIVQTELSWVFESCICNIRC